MTTDAEERRRSAHEYRCPDRPTGDIPWQYERAAYQDVHAAGLRRDLLVQSLLLDDKRTLLRRTWFFDFRGRRELRSEIAIHQGRIAGIHAYALTLGLDSGWSNPKFRPPALR